MALALLSGSDYFHLLIDRKMKRLGMAGNISRIHFELVGTVDLNALAERLRLNRMFQEICTVRYRLRWPFFPVWEKEMPNRESIEVRTGLSGDTFTTSILNRKVDNKIGLVWIDLCELEDGSKHVVISMHHALFDHQGMVNLVYALNGDFTGSLFAEPSSVSGWKEIADSVYMTGYMLGRPAWKLGSLLPKKVPSRVSLDFRELSFTKEQAGEIDRNAWQAGSRIGTSSYLIAATAIAVQHTLLDRGQRPPYLFFSVPHSNRRLGSSGHLCSNQLTFLFFRLAAEDLSDIEKAVTSINLQLRQQIKDRIAERYANLLRSMRLMPIFLYESMVNLASDGRLASFGFSDLGTDQLAFSEWMGCRVKRVRRYPPVPVPPGISVATIRSAHGRQVAIGYGKEILSDSEMDSFTQRFSDAILHSPIP